MALLARAVLDNRNQELRRLVDAAAARGAGPTRLHALARVVAERVEALGAAGPWLSVETLPALAMIDAALERGSRYDEPAAAALLSAATALGAGWFADQRLLGAAALPPAPAPDLFSPRLAALFETASRRAESLHRPAVAALRALLAAAEPATALPALRDAVFAGTPGGAAFEAHEAALCNAAGLHDAALRTLCLAGDLAFGSGRCVRIAERAAAAGSAPLDTLTGALHGMVLDADR